MDPSSHWKALDQHQYKLHNFNNITGELKNLDLYHSRVAIAKLGGPIAATKNLDNIVLMRSEDIVKDQICFFSNSGKIITKIPYKDLERIVLFEFIEDELLLVLKNEGHYYLIDPFNGTRKIYDLGESFRQDKIINAQVCQNGFVVMKQVPPNNGAIEFYYVPSAYEPQLTKLCSPEINVIPEHWIVIPPVHSFSRKVELQVAHPEAGIILIVEDEKKKIYYNKDKQEFVVDKKLPDLRSIKMISVSPNYKFLSYLAFYKETWIMHTLSDDFEATTNFSIKLDLSEDDQKQEQQQIKDRSIAERPQKMLWCGDDCIVLQLTTNIILVGPNVSTKIRMPSKHFATCAEIDGLRFVSQKKNEILRRLPESYINVFQTLSTQPGAMLYSAYESFESRNPIEDDELRSKKGELSQGVLDCIQAGQFEISIDYQTKLLKAASYGKTFLGNQAVDANLLSDVCRILRVVNALRRNGGPGGRCVTFDQLNYLIKNENLFVKLLLRYNLHYLAIEFAKFLKLPLKLRSQIYTHWACCKVEIQQDDETLSQIIKNKISQEKGISFTDIAHKAIEVGKANLALKLLENEPCLAKRVPVLLWMANYQQAGNPNSYYEKALEDALKSRDSNLIYLVIIKFLKGSGLDQGYVFGVLSQNLITQNHLITYLKNFDGEGLQKYLQYLKKFDECGYLAIQQAYQKQNLGDRIKFLEFAAKFFEEDSKDSFYAKVVQEQIQNLMDLKSEADKNKKKAHQEKPLNEILETFLKKQENNFYNFSRDETKIAQEFAKTYKIPERRYLLTRAKALIANKNFEELDRMLNEKNKKSVIVPYELVADLLMKAGEEEKGLQIIQKMPDIEEQVNLLMKIGQPRIAAMAAINQKKFQILHEIRGAVSDPSIILMIDNYLTQNEKK